MKVIIAGGRDFGVLPWNLSRDDPEFIKVEMDRRMGYDALWNALREGVDVEIVSGMAKGADAFGEEYAKAWSIPVVRFPADWDQYGKAAGHKRNYEMARYADVLIAFWDGESRGTRNMIDNALREGLDIHVYRY